MSTDPLEVEVTNRNRPARALVLLREIYRIRTVTEPYRFAAADIWQQVRELLAEETPGREVER